MLDHLLICLFGKRYFVWQGTQELKKQQYFNQLDIMVGEDSIAELEADIHNLEELVDSDLHTKEDAKKMAQQVDTKRAMLTQTTDKLADHRQMQANLQYKLDLFRRL